MLMVPREIHASAGLDCEIMTATWLPHAVSVGLNCSTVRMNRPDARSYTTCGYRTSHPDVFWIIVLMFMYTGGSEPVRVLISRALLTASTMLLGPTAMLGSAGVVTRGLPDPA